MDGQTDGMAKLIKFATSAAGRQKLVLVLKHFAMKGMWISFIES
jgi:hypothetical protein